MMKRWKKIAVGALLVAGVCVFGSDAKAASSSSEAVIVKKGQTLSELAAQYGTSVAAWKYANTLTSDKIVAGQKLNVALAYKVYPGDQLWYLAKRYRTTVADIKILNGLKSDKIVAGQTLVIPVGKKGSQAVKPNAPTVAKPVAGTPQQVKSAPSAATSSQPIHAVASAYGPGNIMWQWGGHTYTGTKVREGVIAVDPSVIPLGSKVWVTGYDSPLLPAGGFLATAEDIGGKIKGNRIDIYIEGSQAELRQFGLQDVKVYILK
jgi:3D (Asp-Asp-Asp) domain-containing protein